VGDIETDKQAAIAAGAHFAYAGPNLYESIKQYALHSDSAFDRAIHSRPTFSQEHLDAVRKEFDGLAKPVGSLGKLEIVAAQIAGITQSRTPTVDPAAIALFGADHGIAADDSVTPWPQAITGMMLEVMGDNKAAVSVLAEVADVYVQIINVDKLVGHADKPAVAVFAEFTVFDDGINHYVLANFFNFLFTQIGVFYFDDLGKVYARNEHEQQPPPRAFNQFKPYPNVVAWNKGFPSGFARLAENAHHSGMNAQ
jgi:hypothetical protein